MEGGGVWGKRSNAPARKGRRRDKNHENLWGTLGKIPSQKRLNYKQSSSSSDVCDRLNREPKTRTRVRLWRDSKAKIAMTIVGGKRQTIDPKPCDRPPNAYRPLKKNETSSRWCIFFKKKIILTTLWWASFVRRRGRHDQAFASEYTDCGGQTAVGHSGYVWRVDCVVLDSCVSALRVLPCRCACVRGRGAVWAVRCARLSSLWSAGERETLFSVECVGRRRGVGCSGTRRNGWKRKFITTTIIFNINSIWHYKRFLPECSYRD